MLLIMRPANIITAIADILDCIAIEGYLVSNVFNQHIIIQIILLTIATIGLYGGGIIFNDDYLNIDWILNEAQFIVSEKDLQLPTLKETVL